MEPSGVVWTGYCGFWYLQNFYRRFCGSPLRGHNSTEKLIQIKSDPGNRRRISRRKIKTTFWDVAESLDVSKLYICVMDTWNLQNFLQNFWNSNEKNRKTSNSTPDFVHDCKLGHCEGIPHVFSGLGGVGALQPDRFRGVVIFCKFTEHYRTFTATPKFDLSRWNPYLTF